MGSCSQINCQVPAYWGQVSYMVNLQERIDRKTDIIKSIYEEKAILATHISDAKGKIAQTEDDLKRENLNDDERAQLNVKLTEEMEKLSSLESTESGIAAYFFQVMEGINELVVHKDHCVRVHHMVPVPSRHDPSDA